MLLCCWGKLSSENANRQAIFRCVGQFGDGLAEDGMNELGGDLQKRRQYEVAVVQVGVGDGQRIRIQHFVIEEKDVDVDDAFSPFYLSDPAHAPFDLLYLFQYFEGPKPGMHQQGLVQEIRLVRDPPGFRVVYPGGFGDGADLSGYPSVGLFQVGCAVAQVSTRMQINFVHSPAKVYRLEGVLNF